ncbi:MAG: hypothetical protein JXB49_20805 [Bacteroidales bacterium]|nr:hypothetical protein [Bacteroidales bacterium]
MKIFWYSIGVMILSIIGESGYSQNITSSQIWQNEQKLKEFFNEIYLSATDNDKLKYNDSVLVLLEETIKMSGSFTYPFDSLSRMGIITSPDKAFRLYNWNLSYMNGTHTYFCFLQKYNKESKEYELCQLFDKSEEITNPEDLILDKDNWFGALYYKIIPVKHKKKEYYVLLGLDLNNFLTTKKIIETLYFDDKENIKFGTDVFFINRKKQRRVIFEYSSNATMTLNSIEKNRIILFDHLSPSRPSLEGKYEHYGPDFSYDALILKKGIWDYVSDYDARNEE